MSELTSDLYSQRISRQLVWILAMACGMTVANLYYNQPLLSDIGRTFHVSVQQLGIISMLTQAGYACGLFLFVPLGDIFERRSLILTMLLAVSIALVAMAVAPNALWFSIASLCVGITTIVPQIIIPLAADVAHESERGKVIGTVMSGLLIGVLLARTVSGFIGAYFGWRTMYWIAAIMMFSLALLLRLILDKNHPITPIRYRLLFSSLFHLVRTQPVLREAALQGGMLFGAFSVFWTTLVFFLEHSPYHYGSQVAGLFGLVGVVGAGIAPIAGRLSDRLNPKIVVAVGIFITILSFVVFRFFGNHLWGIIFGVILLDLGVQGAQISNQARIYQLVPEARSRLNTVYMVTYFFGGALGSFLGTFAWAQWHWPGVCLIGGCMGISALFIWLLGRR